MPNFGKEP